MNMEQMTEKIDRYLDGTMSPDEKASFEKEISNNPALAQQVNVQQNLRGGIERIGMKTAVSATFRKMTLKNKIYKWGVATVAVAAIGTACYFGYNQSGNSSGREITYDLPANNEDGNSIWANADRNLPTQLFTIDPSKDTVIETMDGLVFAIPAGAFLDAKNPVKLEIREALSPLDIIKGGLSTTSDGKPLETGGMFYLNARNGETSLKINPEKPVYANVPTNEIRPGMMLFDGERMADGSINWKNPKQIEKQLVPVDIHSLDFYPKGFREKVAELGFDANNKRITDSIYYSYAGRKRTAYSEYMPVKTSVDSARVRHILVSYRGAERNDPSITRTKEQAKKRADSIAAVIRSGNVRMEDIVEQFTDDPGSKSGNKGDYGWFTQQSGFINEFKDAGFNNPVGATVVIETSFGYHIIQVLDKTKPIVKSYNGDGITSSPDGEALFKANCASCHNASDKMSTGPGLLGVRDRIPSRQWGYDWVHNSSALIASGDMYANKIFKENNRTVQTSFPQLSNEDIDAILDYANAGNIKYEVDPARIAGIWNDKFQNTIIATKEFEERLQVIFQYGMTDIIDLYVNNLDKKMYEIDSMVARNTYIPEFYEFRDRHDGGISISESHMKKLQDFYNRKKEAVDRAAEATFQKRNDQESTEDNKHYGNLAEAASDAQNQYINNVGKEFRVNLEEAYRQLGIEAIQPPANAYYGFNVSNTGWHNVDRYVLESTVTRTTLDYTDSATGKKAVIKYEPLTVTVADANEYELLSVYLVADSLPCFMKINGTNGTYAEKLNELMRYSLVVVGQKSGKWFWTTKYEVKPGTAEVQLEAIEESQLRVNLDHSFSKSLGNDFRKELDRMIETHQYTIALKARLKQEEIDQQIMPVIFPSYSGFDMPLPQPGAPGGK